MPMRCSSARGAYRRSAAWCVLVATGVAVAVATFHAGSSAQELKGERYRITWQGRLDGDMTEGLMTFVGSTRLVSDDLNLSCQKLTCQFDEKGEDVLTLEAVGPLEFTFSAEQDGKRRTIVGSANSARVDNVKKQMRLEGETDVRVREENSPEAHLTADKLNVNMDLHGRTMVAEGKPKADWGAGTVSGDRIEMIFPPADDAPAYAEITGNAHLSGVHEDATTGKKQPVQAWGDSATWSAAELEQKAVLQGNARLEFKGATRFRNAQMSGEIVTARFATLVFESPLVQVSAEGASLTTKAAPPVKEWRNFKPGLYVVTGEARKPRHHVTSIEGNTVRTKSALKPAHFPDADGDGSRMVRFFDPSLRVSVDAREQGPPAAFNVEIEQKKKATPDAGPDDADRSKDDGASPTE